MKLDVGECCYNVRYLSDSNGKWRMSHLKTIDLFSGCGGMSLGFQNAGFDVIAAYDNWQPAVDVYKKNFSHPAVKADLSDPAARQSAADLRPRVVVGGPPCQDFSSAGPGRSSSSRANLVEAFASIVELARPQFFVLENVPRARLSSVFERSVSRLKELGYGLTQIELDAAYCGVPQTRKRLFVIGGLGEHAGFLSEELNSRLAERPLTMREYFGKNLPFEHYFRVPTNYNRRGIFSVDAPSTTVRAIDRPVPKGYKGHPLDPVPLTSDIRELSVQERAQLQTFPVTFKFTGTKTDLNTMIGNAVPVKLAHFVARGLMSHIEKSRNVA